MLIPTSALPAFTAFHVVISLVAIISGVVVIYGMATNKRLDGWTAIFLSTTVATSVTGFGFPINGVTPGIVFGLVSLVVLALAIYARYPRRLAGVWRPVYIISSVFAFYLNFVVLIVQSFQKLPALHALAPNQTELPFLATQIASLVAVLVLGAFGVRRFRSQPV